jgi:DNA polymerase-3 subunit delta'
MQNTHQKQWEFLKNKFEQGQLSHAYLFSGIENLGKKEFAEKFAEFVGCKFPDLMIVGEQSKRDPKFGDGGEIKISQVRDVQNFLSYKSYHGNYKIVIVNEAEKMNQEAQSCFLKTLEEPKGKTILFLVSSKPEILLDTIRSRCQQINFFGKPTESKEQIEKEKEILTEFLKVAGVSLAEKFKYAKALDFEKQNLSEILSSFEKYTRYLLLKKIGNNEKSYFSEIHSALENYTISKLKDIINLTEDIKNKLFFSNVNQKLALEILLLEI